MNTPMLLIGYNRPDLLQRRLNEVFNQDVTPDEIVVSIDGQKNSAYGNQSQEAFNLVFASFSKSSLIRVIYREKNLGCSDHILMAVSEILQKHETVIVVEDDVSISPNFYGTLARQLEGIDSYSMFAVIGGFSPFVCKNRFLATIIPNTWRISKYFSAWGWGTTKFFWDKFVYLTDTIDLDIGLSDSETWGNLTHRKREIWKKRFSRRIWDYQVQFNIFVQDKRTLLPRYRLIDNEGFDDVRSTHTKHSRPWNLFGNGFSITTPSVGPLPKKERILGNFLDANLWAADGYFNARAREFGIRTIVRKTFVRENQ